MNLPGVLEPWLAGPRSAELLFPLIALPVLALLLSPLLGARGARLLALTSLLAGLALVGLPPSGGYPVKSLYGVAAGAHAWWWRPVLELGGLLTAAYLARILAVALRPAALAAPAPVADAMRGALTAGGFWDSAGPVLAVALTVGLFHVAGESAWQRRVAALGRGLAAFDGVLREWRVAGTLLLLILLLQGLAVLA